MHAQDGQFENRHLVSFFGRGGLFCKCRNRMGRSIREHDKNSSLFLGKFFLTRMKNFSYLNSLSTYNRIQEMGLCRVLSHILWHFTFLVDYSPTYRTPQKRGIELKAVFKLLSPRKAMTHTKIELTKHSVATAQL